MSDVKQFVNKILEGADVRKTICEWNISIDDYDSVDIDPFKNGGRDRAKNVLPDGSIIKNKSHLQKFVTGLINSLSFLNIVNVSDNILDLFCVTLGTATNQFISQKYPYGAHVVCKLPKDKLFISTYYNDDIVINYNGKNVANYSLRKKYDVEKAFTEFINLCQSTASSYSKKNNLASFGVDFVVDCWLLDNADIPHELYSKNFTGNFEVNKFTV